MRIKQLKLLPLLFLLTGCLLTTVRAQDETAPTDAPTANQPKRPGLMAQLNLTQVQIEQIREINRQNRPQIREANQRLKEANRNLDAAIYGDAANEADIQLKIKEVHAAHAEVIKLRTANEFAVRKVLSREQLAKFREIRRQQIDEKENLPRLRNNKLNNQTNNPNRPLKNRLPNTRPLN